MVATPSQEEQRHTIAVLVDNEPGVLARVVGMFSGRGYNIDSLTVALVDPVDCLSRITIVTSGTAMVIEQIKAQLERLIPVHKVRDLTIEGRSVERELFLIKVTGSGENRIEALRLANIFKAEVLDATLDSFIFSVTGTSEEGEDFIRLMRQLGMVELCRTGVLAMSRGSAGF